MSDAIKHFVVHESYGLLIPLSKVSGVSSKPTSPTPDDIITIDNEYYMTYKLFRKITKAFGRPVTKFDDNVTFSDFDVPIEVLGKGVIYISVGRETYVAKCPDTPNKIRMLLLKFTHDGRTPTDISFRLIDYDLAKTILDSIITLQKSVIETYMPVVVYRAQFGFHMDLIDKKFDMAFGLTTEFIDNFTTIDPAKHKGRLEEMSVESLAVLSDKILKRANEAAEYIGKIIEMKRST